MSNNTTRNILLALASALGGAYVLNKMFEREPSLRRNPRLTEEQKEEIKQSYLRELESVGTKYETPPTDIKSTGLTLTPQQERAFINRYLLEPSVSLEAFAQELSVSTEELLSLLDRLKIDESMRTGEPAIRGSKRLSYKSKEAAVLRDYLVNDRFLEDIAKEHSLHRSQMKRYLRAAMFSVLDEREAVASPIIRFSDDIRSRQLHDPERAKFAQGGPHSKLSKEEIDDILVRAQEDPEARSYHIAREYSISVQTLIRLLKQKGVYKPKRTPLTDSEVLDIITELLTSNISLKDLAEEFETSTKNISRMCLLFLKRRFDQDEMYRTVEQRKKARQRRELNICLMEISSIVENLRTLKARLRVKTLPIRNTQKRIDALLERLHVLQARKEELSQEVDK